MKQAYRVLAFSVALGVVIQASSIALGWFLTLHEIDDGATIDKNYDGNIGHTLHGVFGMGLIPLVALALFIVAFFAHVPDGVKWAGFVLLAVVAQVILAFISFGVPAVGALHGINALVVMGLAGTAGSRVTKLSSPTRSSTVPA
jgi:hypothetical protein